MRLLEVSATEAEGSKNRNPLGCPTSGDTQPIPVFPGPYGTFGAQPATDPQHPTAATAPVLAQGGGRLPVRCCVCKRVRGYLPEYRLPLGAKASDGCCPKCWGPYRKDLGLAPKPYPGGAW